MQTSKSILGADPGIARWRWLFVAVLILPPALWGLGRAVAKTYHGLSLALQICGALSALILVMIIGPQAFLCCWKRSRAKHEAGRPWLRTEFPWVILLGVAPLAVMGLSPTGSELYIGAAASLCVFLGLVTLRHLVRLCRQDPEEWGHRGGLDFLVDLQVVIWFPLILMLGGFVATALHFSCGGPCTLLGMLGCALLGVIGFAAKFWIECKSGVPWWRSDIVRIGLGLGLFIGALWLLMPMIKSDRGAWMTSDVAEKIEIGLMVVPMVILFGIFLRDAWCLRQQHPDEWKSRLMEKWRRHLGPDKEAVGDSWLQRLEKLDVQDSSAVQLLIAEAKVSRDACQKALVGHRLWRDPTTQELGRPLLEEAAAAGEELACMTLRGERLEKCDMNDPEVVYALVDEAVVAARPGLAYDLGMRLVHTEHAELGKKLLQRVIAQGSDDIQVVQAKLACLDYDDAEAIAAMADEARRQIEPYLAMFLGMRLRFQPEHKALGRELMVWAAEKEPAFRKSLQSGDDQERIFACDLGDPQIRADLEAEAMGRKDGGDFAVTLACSLWSHDAEAGRRLFLWAEAQGHDYARRMLEDFENTSDSNTAGGTPAIQ